MPRLPLLPLTVLCLLSTAAAEVGGTVQATLSAPELSGLTRGGTATAPVLRAPDGSSVTLSVKIGASGTPYVQSAVVQQPKLNAKAAGTLLSGLTGSDYTQGLVDYLGQARVKAQLAGGVDVNADAYDLHLQGAGQGLTLRVTLHQTSGFAPVPPARVLGNVSAPHVIRMYSDLQCPYCQKAELQALPAVLKTLPADVRFEFHHVPLTRIHPNAFSAAEASVCAERQGKFFPFKDALFHRDDWQRAADPSVVFTEAARGAGLDVSSFQSCMAAHNGKDEVQAGLDEAEQVDIQGTPTVFIDGYQVPDPYTAASYLHLLDLVRGK